LGEVSEVGKVCGAATHAVGGDAGYGLLSRFGSAGWFFGFVGENRQTLKVLAL